MERKRDRGLGERATEGIFRKGCNGKGDGKAEVKRRPTPLFSMPTSLQ